MQLHPEDILWTIASLHFPPTIEDLRIPDVSSLLFSDVISADSDVRIRSAWGTCNPSVAAMLHLTTRVKSGEAINFGRPNLSQMLITSSVFSLAGYLQLSAFALTTFVLSLINIGARGVTTPNIVVGFPEHHLLINRQKPTYERTQ